MEALHFDGRALALVDKPVPTPRAGEARVRVLLAGICSTDREIVRGYMGFIGTPGHEMVGIVESAPDAPQWEGRRVVGEINAACRACETCRRGLPSHCPNRTVLGIAGRDGTHAGYVTLPIANLHAVPADISDRAAVFVEPLAAAFEPLAQGVEAVAGQPVVVLGDGKLGLLQAAVLATTGAAVTLVGRHARKLEIAERFGARGVRVEDAMKLPKVELVAECTGTPTGLALALRLLQPRGTLVLKSTYAGEPPLNLAPIVVDEIRVVGSRCGPFPEALAALGARRVAVEALVDAEMPLRDGLAAYERARMPGTLKVLLRP